MRSPRLEQGISRSASKAVLDALARALRLDRDERAHLHRLARARRRPRRRPAPERLRPEVRLLLDTLDHAPALVLGRRVDILAGTAWRTRCSPDTSIRTRLSTPAMGRTGPA